MNTQRSRLRILIPLILIMIVSIIALALYSDKIKAFSSTSEKGAQSPASPPQSNDSNVPGTSVETPQKEENATQIQEENKTGFSGIGSGTLDLPNNDSISFLKSLMAFTFVLGLIFLAAYFYKKIMGIKTTGSRTNRVPINMIGHLPLGEKKFLTIIEIQDKHYFIGITPSTINLLSKLQLDLPPETITSDGDSDFENIFKRARALLQKSKK